MHLVDTAAPDASRPPKRINPIRSSWRTHVGMPWIPALVVLWCCLLYYVADRFAGEDLGPGTLARLFALPPLDSYGDLRLIENRAWLLPATIVLRAALVTTIVALVTRTSLRLKNVVKVAAINVIATVSIFVFVVLGWLYFQQKSEAVLVGDATPMLPALLLLQMAGYVGMCALFSPMICRAAVGAKIRPSLAPAVWLLSAVSVWVWLFASRRVDAVASGSPTIAYAVALLLIVGQSLLLGGVAMRNTQAKKELT